MPGEIGRTIVHAEQGTCQRGSFSSGSRSLSSRSVASRFESRGRRRFGAGEAHVGGKVERAVVDDDIERTRIVGKQPPELEARDLQPSIGRGRRQSEPSAVGHVRAQVGCEGKRNRGLPAGAGEIRDVHRDVVQVRRERRRDGGVGDVHRAVAHSDAADVEAERLGRARRGVRRNKRREIDLARARADDLELDTFGGDRAHFGNPSHEVEPLERDGE